MSWTRRDSLAAAALALAPFLFFFPLFLPGAGRHYIEGGDFVDQFYAFAAYETQSFAAGRLPLWNPFAYAGAPFWADIQAAVAYPPSLLVVLMSAALFGRLPFLALELESVAHIALAGVGTYLFARHVLNSRPAGLFAAVCFAFGGYLTGYPPLQLAVLEADAWLGLVLLGVVLTVDDGGLAIQLKAARGRPGRRLELPHPLLPLALGMVILAGHPQSALYVLYAATAFLAWRTWPWRERGWAPWRRCGPALVLAGSLSAAGWLPAYEFLGLSNRATADYAALAHGFPARELVGIVLAGITKWSPLYVGVLPLLLALAAAWAALIGRDAAARARRFWVVLGVVALLLSLGGNAFLFDLFYLVAPGFDLFRGQERAALLVSFSLAMLAGAAFGDWCQEQSDGRPIGRAVANGALVLAGCAFLLSLVATPDYRPLALRLLFLAGGASVLAAGRWWRRLPRPAWFLAVLALTAADLYAVNAWTNLDRGAPGELQITEPLYILTSSQAQRVQNDHRLPDNFGVLHGLEATSGASPLRLRRFEVLRDGLADREVRLWDLLAVSDVLTWRSELEVPAETLFSAGEADTAVSLLRLETATPFVWRAAAAEAVASDDEALVRLRDQDFNPLSTVLLHGGESSDTPGAQVGGLGLVSRRPGETVVTTAGGAPAWIVFSEMDYPGWRATVDGAPAEILRADVALIAVPVPAGDHEVRLYFTAPWVSVGIALSLASLLLLLVWLVAIRWWPSRPGALSNPVRRSPGC